MSREIPFRKYMWIVDIEQKTALAPQTLKSNYRLQHRCLKYRFFITDVSISNAWKTVEEGINDTLYILKVNPNPPNALQQYLGYLVRLASNNNPSTLATELQTRLRENTGSQTFLVSTDSKSANSGITISNTDATYQWKLLTDDDFNKKQIFIIRFNI